MFSTQSTWSRRDYIRAGSLGFFGLHCGLQAAPAKAKSCILIWLEGGPAQMDTFDPKSNSNFRPIATNVAGIQVSELLPQLAKDRKSTRLNSSHTDSSRMPSSA